MRMDVKGQKRGEFGMHAGGEQSGGRHTKMNALRIDTGLDTNYYKRAIPKVGFGGTPQRD